MNNAEKLALGLGAAIGFGVCKAAHYMLDEDPSYAAEATWAALGAASGIMTYYSTQCARGAKVAAGQAYQASCEAAESCKRKLGLG